MSDTSRFDTSKSGMDKNLSADTSPSTVELKKRVRRLNGLPMFLALTVAVIIAVTLSLVVLNRQKFSTDPGKASGDRNTLVFPKNIIDEGNDGKAKEFRKQQSAEPANGAGFTCVIDLNGERLRVTLRGGDEMLIRLHRVQDGDDDEFHAPMGAWVRKR